MSECKPPNSHPASNHAVFSRARFTPEFPRVLATEHRVSTTEGGRSRWLGSLGLRAESVVEWTWRRSGWHAVCVLSGVTRSPGSSSLRRPKPRLIERGCNRPALKHCSPSLWARQEHHAVRPRCAFRETQTDKPSIADTVSGHGDVSVAMLGIVAGTIIEACAVRFESICEQTQESLLSATRAKASAYATVLTPECVK